MKLLRKLLADRTGGAVVEYAFVAGLIAVGSLAGITGLGGAVNNSYNNTATAVADVNDQHRGR